MIEKLKVVTESELSAEEKAARYEELMQEEEKRQREIEAELKRLRDLLFTKQRELHQTKTKERNMEAEIQVCVKLCATKGIEFECLPAMCQEDFTQFWCKHLVAHRVD